MDADESEAEGHLPEDMEDELSADNESDGSDAELGAHVNLPVASAALQRCAELDILDSSGQKHGEASGVEGMLEEMDIELAADTVRPVESSDEEPGMEPVRRRLRSKQAAPEFGPPKAMQAGRREEREQGARLPVMKRPGMLKRPAAGRAPKTSKCCRGYEGLACIFSPVRPGQPAEVHPQRGQPTPLHFLQEGAHGGNHSG